MIDSTKMVSLPLINQCKLDYDDNTNKKMINHKDNKNFHADDCNTNYNYRNDKL